MKADGIGVGYVIGGLVLTWSGFKNQSLAATAKSLLAGKDPAVVTESAPSIGFGHTSGSGTGGGSTGSAPPTAAGGTLTNAQIRSLWVLAGGNPSTAAVAACIAFHESSYKTGVTSSNPDGGTNVGLWQLDTPGGAGAGYSITQLKDPLTNARVAVKFSKNGTDWADWSSAPLCGV